MRDTLGGASGDSSSISIGDASLGDSGSLNDVSHVKELNTLANRYLNVGAAMLAAIQPTSVRLHHKGEFVQSPRFKLPFNGF